MGKFRVSTSALHSRLMPRHDWAEEEKKRQKPACLGYSRNKARPFDLEKDSAFMQKVRAFPVT